MEFDKDAHERFLKKLIDRWDAKGGQITLEITVNINSVTEKPERAHREARGVKPCFKDYKGEGFK